MSGKEAYESVVAAVKMGYRHIDCAPVYNNEKQSICELEPAVLSPIGVHQNHRSQQLILTPLFEISQSLGNCGEHTQVGDAFQQLFKEGVVKREELFVTSKILVSCSVSVSVMFPSFFTPYTA
eukprot:scaffold78193_cov20-Tisochrysis_lutea.AAC.1